jgi:SRSO17 transposase
MVLARGGRRLSNDRIMVAAGRNSEVTEDDLYALLPELERFHARFGRFFPRSESRSWSLKYLYGLTLPIERKNVENIAEQVGAPPRKLQEFLSDSPWDGEGCIDELQRLVGELMGASNGVLILDESGFPKKGIWSAGVARQYSGALGRVDNCQVGVFLNYASVHGHTLVDRCLYVPEKWFGTEAEARRNRASVPGELRFKTKIELGVEMLKRAQGRGHLRYQWVTGDALYGDSHDLRQVVEEQGKWYCFEVSSDAMVWSSEPNWQVPEREGKRGRPRTRKLPMANSPDAVTVAGLTATLPETEWIRHRVTEGAKGPREYEFVRVRVIEKRHKRPGNWGWMMVRRPVGCRDPREFKHYLSNAPETVALAEMAWVGCLRWTIEQDFELAKGELGLDHYEVTKYRGWHHHVTLAMLALAFLKSVQRRWGEKWHGRLGAGSTPTAEDRSASRGVDTGAHHRLVGAPATPKTGGSVLPLGAMVA